MNKFICLSFGSCFTGQLPWSIWFMRPCPSSSSWSVSQFRKIRSYFIGDIFTIYKSLKSLKSSLLCFHAFPIEYLQDRRPSIHLSLFSIYAWAQWSHSRSNVLLCLMEDTWKSLSSGIKWRKRRVSVDVPCIEITGCWFGKRYLILFSSSIKFAKI